MSKNCLPFRAHLLLLSLGLSGIVLSPLSNAADDDTHKEWSCHADADGGWVCSEKTVAGRSYPRPHHAEPEVVPEDEGPQVRIARNLDWVDEEDMTDEEREVKARGCCGAYIEPERDYPEADLAPDKAALRVAATSTEVEQETNVAHLEGNVQLTQGYRQVRSDRATVDQTGRTVDLEGQVQFREPGSLIIGDSAHINLDNNAAQINNVSFVAHEAGIRGTAEKLIRESESIFYIDNATYTTCEPSSNSWQLVMADATINMDTGIAIAKHTRLELKGVPVIYLPWMRYPIDDRRTTGLLYPSISVGQDNGVDYAQPIYLNLAPNYDATITPRFIQERGTMAEVEGRYLSESTYTVVGGGFLGSDDGGDDEDDPVKTFKGEDRWAASVQHDGGIGHPWNTKIDYTRISDNEYFRDLGNTTLEVNSQTHLRQSASVGYNLKNWNLNLQSTQFQTIIDNEPRQYKLLPRVVANGRYRAGDLAFELKNQFTSFDHTDDNVVDTSINALKKDTENTFITGDRLRLDYAASWDKQWAWGYFRPTAKVKYLTYDLDNPLSGQTNDNPSVTVPVGIIDAGLFAERDTTWLDGYIQTFEPRLYYLYSEFEDQSELPNFDTSLLTFSYNQLFRDDRFTGGDRIGDADQLSIGLTSRLIEKSTGIEKFRASVGQIFYFDDRFVSLNSSLTKDIINNPNSFIGMLDLNNLSQTELTNLNDLNEQVRDDSVYAGELALRLSKSLRFQADVLYDDENSELDKGSAYLRYRDENANIFNLGYRYTRRTPRISGLEQFDADIDQGDVSAVIPLFDHWRFIGRWNYDFTNNRELETFAGIEYDSCCWRVSLLARRWIERDDRNDAFFNPEDDLEEDNGVFLQIQLKGLGGTGSKVESLLEDGIYGFQRDQ